MDIISPCAPFEALLSPKEKTQVLVLGTVHLGGSRDVVQMEIQEFADRALIPLLDTLASFQPDFVGIESYPPETIAWMVHTQGREDTENLLPFVKFAHQMQDRLRLSWKEAQERALGLLKQRLEQDLKQRGEVVAHLLASYDWYSALLQWSYLPRAFRETYRDVPEEIRAALEHGLLAQNEAVSIGVVLAKRLGHQRIYSIDDGIEGDLPDPSQLQVFLEEFEASDVCQTFLKQLQEEVKIEEEQLVYHVRQGNLLPFYQKLNAEGSLRRSMAQWLVFFRTRFASGLDRARVAMWEVRNLHMAANIRKVTALKPGGRMLVIVGASHKPFLDAYLRSLVDIEIVDLGDLIESPQNTA